MKILVVDDDRLVSSSLKIILEATGDMTVAALGESGEEAIALYEKIRPDVLLMDIRMKKMSGLEAGAIILKNHPEARILYLTTFKDDEYIVRALKMGAKGYLLKQDFESIAPAIRAVASGQSVFGDAVMTRLPELLNREAALDFEAYAIGERERSVIEAVAQGLSNREIAQKLCLSEGTVRNYISTVLDKLELRDRTQLAIFYFNHK